MSHEIIALWQKQVAHLKSIFMVTYNIEEAVEMATRIRDLFLRIPDDWASYWKTNCHIRAMPSAEWVLQDIAHALPYDNPEKVLRFIRPLFRGTHKNYNATTKTVFVPKEVEETAAR